MKITIGNVEVTADSGIVSWTSSMQVDADGSPRAYAPIGSKLQHIDDLRNAGYPGKFYAIVTNSSGVPYVQQAGDLYPGRYISTTALQDYRYGERDPRRYINSEKMPYISIPPQLEQLGVKLGDLAQVTRGPFSCGALVSDIGPRKQIGEASILLHQVLGLDPFRGLPKHYLVGTDEPVSFKIFVGSVLSPPWPRPNDDIQNAVRALQAAS